MSALFLQTGGYGKDEVYKKCFYEGLNFLCSNLPDTCSMNLLVIYEKQKTDKIILLLVNQNRKLKKTVNLRARRTRKKRCT